MSTVTIPEHAYRRLLEDTKILNALYAGGVTGWDWYDASLEAAGIIPDDGHEEEEDED